MILIGGGSRSGKSRAALDHLQAAGPRQAFIATAQAHDQMMEERISMHRAERAAAIVTFEEPLQVSHVIEREAGHFDAIVVDCLTLWLSNLMLAERFHLRSEFERLVETAANAASKIIFVTNEVGCGIVPDNEMAIRFRDEAGRLNQLAAGRAEEVHWMMFGLALRLK